MTQLIAQSQYQKLQDLGIKIPETTQNKPVDEAYFKQVCQKVRDSNACVVAHYYTDESLQRLAEQTGGIVSDSLEMAKFGAQSKANKLIVCGVRFMGETAKTLTFDKQILMPDLDAQCSLDLNCPLEKFQSFVDQHLDRTVVVYANTSAQVKAISDWVVTSSIALEVVKHLHQKKQKIIWAPDKYLGHYVQKHTGADMLLWDGACVVHESFQLDGIEQLKKKHPQAVMIAHPEAQPAILEKAKVVGSTKALIEATVRLKDTTFIVATDPGILYQMKKASPHKTFLPAPTGGHGATCQSCNFCPWMAMNDLQKVESCLDKPHAHEIKLSKQIATDALKPIQKMLHFAQKLHLPTDGDS